MSPVTGARADTPGLPFSTHTPVIHDADHDGDCDDIGDDGSLCYWQKLGVLDVICAGLTSGNTNAASGLAAVYQHLLGTPLPYVGAYKGSIADAGSSYNTTLATNYPHTYVGSNASQPNSVTLYRQLLARYEAASSKSVWFVMTGGANAMSDLLQSTADGFSASNGVTLVTNSTAGIVFVAGRDGTTEYNTDVNRTASNYVCANWPTTLVWCDIGLGDLIVMAQSHWHSNLPTSCPIRAGYDLDPNSGNGVNGRNAWSQLGIEYVANTGLYTTTNGTYAVNASTGVGTWTSGAGTHKRLGLASGWNAAMYAARWEAQIVAHGV